MQKIINKEEYNCYTKMFIKIKFIFINKLKAFTEIKEKTTKKIIK